MNENEVHDAGVVPDVPEVVRALQDRVDERRRAGDYPPGLEEQLEAEFAEIMRAVHRHEIDTSELGRRVAQVEHSAGSMRGVADTSSRMPGGQLGHSTAARLVSRHTNLLADGVRQLGVDVARALHEVHHLLEVQRSADERQLHEVVASLIDRVAVIDHVADALVLLESRVAELERRSEAR